MSSTPTSNRVSEALQSTGETVKHAAHDVAEEVSAAASTIGEAAGERLSAAKSELTRRGRRAARRADKLAAEASKRAAKARKRGAKRAKKARSEGAKRASALQSQASNLVGEVSTNVSDRLAAASGKSEPKRRVTVKRVLGVGAVLGLVVVVVRAVRGRSTSEPLTAPIRPVPRPSATDNADSRAKHAEPTGQSGGLADALNTSEPASSGPIPAADPTPPLAGTDAPVDPADLGDDAQSTTSADHPKPSDMPKHKPDGS